MPKCPTCGSEPRRLGVDHCHLHGQTRGAICQRCNYRMMWIDRGMIPPRCPVTTLTELAAHAAHCLDCAPVNIAGLIPAQHSATKKEEVHIRGADLTRRIRAYAEQHGISLAAAVSVLLQRGLKEES
jgi:Recombination endonuclease VII